MRIICIVQARMGSKRLPGKVLLPLNGHTVIAEVIDRCRRIRVHGFNTSDLVVAIPDTPENDVLHHECDRCNVMVFRGPEDDVLKRYWLAARWAEAELIIRITADCPLISPQICEDVVREWRRKVDYVSNVGRIGRRGPDTLRWFPRGYDCEVFTMKALHMAHRKARGPRNREHVTPWMRNTSLLQQRFFYPPWPMDGRLCLDTEDDYKVICAAFNDADQHLQRA